LLPTSGRSRATTTTPSRPQYDPQENSETHTHESKNTCKTMFSLFNGIYDSYLAPSEINLLVVGAPNAGKSALLERLKVSEIPTRPKSGSTTNTTRRFYVVSIEKI
jgi:ribosome biogenesis GTPase A